jgi:hypothetical protein
MNHSGDAAEQIVRMTLEGVEVAARITGTAAKEIALLLLAAVKSPDKSVGSNIKLRGKARLNSMLKSGKALEIFSLRERDLRTFVREAKQYGIVYCVLRSSKQTPDGLCDIMVKADDAPKINRLIERYKFAAVDKAKIESEITRDMRAQATGISTEPVMPSNAEPDEAEVNNANMLIDELLGSDESNIEPETGLDASDNVGTGKAAQVSSKAAEAETIKTMPKKARQTTKKETQVLSSKAEANPLVIGGSYMTDNSLPPKTIQSGLSSESKKKSANHISSKPSVKAELREITAMKKADEALVVKREAPAAEAKSKGTQITTHKQLPNRQKSKSKKAR